VLRRGSGGNAATRSRALPWLLLCILATLHCRWGYDDLLPSGSALEPEPDHLTGSEPVPTCSDILGADCTQCSQTPCPAPSCTDGVQDGDETDIDCGGSSCAPCEDGHACGSASDCTSQVCSASLCVAVSCSDKLRNGDETDVDCGGSACSPCGAGSACSASTDCSSLVC